MEEALAIDISSYLSSQGIQPMRETYKLSYYRSPLPGRSDSSPSFVVNKATNRWIDYGISRDSDRIIKLVCLMEGCTLNRAIDILLGKEKTQVKKFDKKFQSKSPSNVQVVSTGKYFDDNLLRYVQKKRKLKISLVRKYCKQVKVKFPNSKIPQRVFSFIGFKNNLGGYELRSPSLKVSVSPKYYTLLGAGKSRFIFEGFMDYLSYLAYHRIGEINGMAIVLNSLTLLPWIYDIMRSEGENNLFFDNDRAANRSIAELEKQEIDFIDHRRSYKLYNDYNKMLCNEIML